jgi:uncharacterized membrane protein
MQINKVSAGRGRAWIECGWALLRQDPWRWGAVAALYMLFAVALDQLPFVGRLLLVLITPLLVAGPMAALQEAAGAPVPAPAPERPVGATAIAARIAPSAVRAARTLVQGFTEPEKMMHLLVVGALSLGAVVLLQILAQLLRVGGHLLVGLPAAIAASGFTLEVAAPLIGLAVVLSLRLILILAVLYAVPLIMLAEEPPLAALRASLAAARRNPMALGLFGLAFAAAYLLLVVPFALWHPLGYLVALTAGSLVAAVFLTGVYCSYRELFRPGP